eukprot:204591-Chlamydomonas_euryale.AAC.1
MVCVCVCVLPSPAAAQCAPPMSAPALPRTYVSLLCLSACPCHERRRFCLSACPCASQPAA